MNFGLRIPNRRGLSDIVSTVLLILLVIIAIAIIWAFLRPSTEEGARQVSSADDCLRIQLEPLSCTYNSCALPGQQGSNTASVSIRRTGRGDLTDIIFVFTDAEGRTKTIWNKNANFPGVVPGEGNLMLAGFFLQDFNPIKVRAVASVGGDDHVCPALSKESDCRYQSSASNGLCADCQPNQELDVFDYICFQNEWGNETSYGDFTRDGDYDVNDFIAYCAAFGAVDCSGCTGYSTCCTGNNCG